MYIKYLFTGIVPGIAQSKSDTEELIGQLKFVEAPENNFDFVKICACISKPIVGFHSLL